MMYIRQLFLCVALQWCNKKEREKEKEKWEAEKPIPTQIAQLFWTVDRPCDGSNPVSMNIICPSQTLPPPTPLTQPHPLLHPNSPTILDCRSPRQPVLLLSPATPACSTFPWSHCCS
jgi:hypothetical protein